MTNGAIVQLILQHLYYQQTVCKQQFIFSIKNLNFSFLVHQMPPNSVDKEGRQIFYINPEYLVCSFLKQQIVTIIFQLLFQNVALDSNHGRVRCCLYLVERQLRLKTFQEIGFVAIIDFRGAAFHGGLEGQRDV